MSEVYKHVLIGLSITALATSAKAIIDVEVLKAENRTVKSLLLEVRQDVKMMHRLMYEKVK